MATMKMDGGGKSPKKTTTTKLTPVKKLKREELVYSKSGDTTRVKYPEKMSSGGVKSQLSKIMVEKSKKPMSSSGDKPQYPKLMLKKSSRKMM